MTPKHTCTSICFLASLLEIPTEVPMEVENVKNLWMEGTVSDNNVSYPGRIFLFTSLSHCLQLPH